MFSIFAATFAFVSRSGRRFAAFSIGLISKMRKKIRNIGLLTLCGLGLGLLCVNLVLSGMGQTWPIYI